MRYISLNTDVTAYTPETRTFALASTVDLDLTDYANVSVIQEFVQAHHHSSTLSKWAIVELVRSIDDSRHPGDGNLYNMTGVVLQYFASINPISVLPIINDVQYNVYVVTLQGPGGVNRTTKVTSKSVTTTS